MIIVPPVNLRGLLRVPLQFFLVKWVQVVWPDGSTTVKGPKPRPRSVVDEARRGLNLVPMGGRRAVVTR